LALCAYMYPGGSPPSSIESIHSSMVSEV
jgi:hypothetical protein